MRIAPLALALVLGGCTLDLFNGDEDPTDPVPPAPRCTLGSSYRMPQTDCGPLPPDSPPPTSCYWTITVEPDLIDYCYSDVCEAMTYECSGNTVTGHSYQDRVFNGTVLPNGNLYWDGGGYQGGEYTPY